MNAEGWPEAVNRWLDFLGSAGSPATTLKLRRVQLGRLEKDLRVPSPWALTEEDLTAWLRSKDWVPGTRRSYRSALRMFYAWGFRTGRVAADPAAELPPVPIPRGMPRPVPDSVLAAAKERATADEHLMLRLGAEVGLRCSEIATVHSANLQEDLLGWSLRVKGKGGHTRVVPLNPRLAIALRARGQGWVFPGRIDGHVSPVVVSRILSEVLGPGFTGHMLRHRFASRAYAADRDLRAVQELLGHASPTTTAIYTAVPDGALRAAVMAAVS